MGVWLGSTFEQTIGACFQMLRDADERPNSERIFTALNASDGLGVNAHQFGEALLRQIRPQTGVGHVAANDAQELLIDLRSRQCCGPVHERLIRFCRLTRPTSFAKSTLRAVASAWKTMTVGLRIPFSM